MKRYIKSSVDVGDNIPYLRALAREIGRSLLSDFDMKADIWLDDDNYIHIDNGDYEGVVDQYNLTGWPLDDGFDLAKSYIESLPY